MHVSPIDEFLAWFLNLPLEQRQDIAALAGQFVPGFDQISMGDGVEAVVAKFVELAKLSKRRGQMREAGMALALRSFIEVVILRDRASREHWHSAEATLQQLSVQHENPKFEEMSRQIPMRREAWIRSAAQWKPLAQGPLSDESLSRWATKAL